MLVIKYRRKGRLTTNDPIAADGNGEEACERKRGEYSAHNTNEMGFRAICPHNSRARMPKSTKAHSEDVVDGGDDEWT